MGVDVCALSPFPAAEGLTSAKATELQNLLLGRHSPSSRASPAVVALGPSVTEEEEEDQDTGKLAGAPANGAG